MIWGDLGAAVQREQSSEQRRELRRPFYRLHLRVSVPPLTPRFSHVLISSSPFHLDFERRFLLQGRFPCRLQVVARCMMRLTVTRQMLYKQVFKRDATGFKARLVPD